MCECRSVNYAVGSKPNLPLLNLFPFWFGFFFVLNAGIAIIIYNFIRGIFSTKNKQTLMDICLSEKPFRIPEKNTTKRHDFKKISVFSLKFNVFQVNINFKKNS